MKAWKSELWLLIITFIWGGTFIFTKIGLHDCPPAFYLLLRILIALTISLIFFGKYLLKLNPTTLTQGLLLGFFFGGGFLLQTYGLKFTTVSKSAFITGMAVVFTPFVFKFLIKKRIANWHKIAVVVAFVGLYIFTNPSISNINLGDFLTLISTIFWAFYITYMDIFTKDKTTLGETAQLVILQLFTCGIMSLIVFLGIDFNDFYFELSSNLIISLAYNSIIASFLLTLIHTSVQKFTTPVKAALIFSLEPVIASFIAMVAINEILVLREYVGAAVMFIGVLISEIGDFVFKTNK